MEIKATWTRAQFIKSLFEFYGVEPTEIKITSYNDALSVKYSVDWHGLYLHIIKNAEKRYLPMPEYIIKILPNYKKVDLTMREDDGCEILIEDKDGKYSSGVLASYCGGGISIKDLIKRGNIRRITKYPKGTTLMIGFGAQSYKVYFNPNTKDIPNYELMTDKEREEMLRIQEDKLKKQVKVLYSHK